MRNHAADTVPHFLDNAPYTHLGLQSLCPTANKHAQTKCTLPTLDPLNAQQSYLLIPG